MLTGVVVLHTQPQISLPPPHILPHPLPSKATHQTALKRDVMVSTLESLHPVSALMDYPPNPTGTKKLALLMHLMWIYMEAGLYLCLVMGVVECLI